MPCNLKISTVTCDRTTISCRWKDVDFVYNQQLQIERFATRIIHWDHVPVTSWRLNSDSMTVWVYKSAKLQLNTAEMTAVMRCINTWI